MLNTMGNNKFLCKITELELFQKMQVKKDLAPC